MSASDQRPLQRTGRNPAGPQGTRVFSTTALRQYASEADLVSGDPARARDPVLEGISPGLEKLRFQLRPGRQTIGRGLDNDLVLDDSSVSASHGWITGQQRRYVIMNTLSTNGTYVNDRRIHQATLKHGDHIRLGEAELLFLTRERSASPWPRLRWIVAGLVLLGLVALAWWLI